MVMPALSDVRHDLGGGFQAHVAGPGQAALGQGHRRFGWGAVGDLDAAGGAGVGLDGVGVGDGGGQADAAGGGGEGAQAGDAERELVAALGAGQGVDFVHDDAGQGLEESRGRRAGRCRTARLSGVVSRMCGGVALWRARRLAGVSPVRASMVTGRPMSWTGRVRLRAMSVASAFSGLT